MARTSLLALVDAALSEICELEGEEEAQRRLDRIDRWSAITEIVRESSSDDELPMLDSGEFASLPDAER